MYPIRPHSSNTVELDLPTNMYPVRPILGQSQSSIDPSVIKDLEHRQDQLLNKIDQLFQQLTFYEKCQVLKQDEPLVVHLSASQPSKGILNLIEQHRDQLFVETYRHSSLRSTSTPTISSTNSSANQRKLTVIWGEGEQLPYMLHAQMPLHDEQAIINFLSTQLITKK